MCRFLSPLAFLCDDVVCRLICSSTETLRKQRSRRRKLLLPLSLPLSLITQRLISGVEASGPLMLLHRLLLLLALVPSGVLLQVCAENFIIFVMEPLLKCTLCSNGSYYSPDHLICWGLLMYKFVVNTVIIISFFHCSSSSYWRWLGSSWGSCTCGGCCSSGCCSGWLGPSCTTRRPRLGVGIGPPFVMHLEFRNFSKV